MQKYVYKTKGLILLKSGDSGGKLELFIFNSAQSRLPCKEANERMNLMILKPFFAGMLQPFKF
jgi:hypothetical protein